MSRLVAAALVLLLTVGGLFGVAAWNRSNDVQTMVVTERELSLPYGWPDPDAEARLGLGWQGRREPQDARLWLPDLKLRDLGFATGVPAGAPEAAEFYGRSLPRLAWVAFEHDGPAWRQLEQRHAMTGAGDRHAAWARESSRLVPVDAAPEPVVLRRRYAGQPVIVLPAIIQMRYRNAPTEGPSVWAEVERLAQADLAIPLHLRGRLPTARAETGRAGPRYEVELGVGRLGVAWVLNVRPVVD